jgi:superfamily II DNA/RNA helicase
MDIITNSVHLIHLFVQSDPSAAIVFVRDERTCLELEEFLTKGGRQALKCRFKRYLQRKKRMTFSPKSGPKFGQSISQFFHFGFNH